ncbi:hypothetical protein [Nonomuraea sp. SYSU D8015]|uniref:hypothetical protein n=1 Tax=Nonomuraea sp. SYSU D8015 TaxID=2593644 RepID=UPI00166126C6|nr:hypothetical protein [Nonomuraea sp. SYSU D8015]
MFGNPAPGAVVPPGKVRIEESRLIPAKVRAEAALAAPLVHAAAQGDADALKRLAAYKDRMSDPAFATALLEEIGPQALVSLPALMAARVSKAIGTEPGRTEAMRRDNRALLSMLSKALAAATDPARPTRVGTRFLDALREEGRKERKAPGAEGQTYAGYWAFGQILAADPGAKYSAWFMSTIGRDMIAWDREYLKKNHVPFMPRDDASYGLVAPMDTRPVAGSPDIAAADPIAALMTLAGASRENAQTLLGHGDTLKYLLHDRRPQWGMGDRGESLGGAMEAAMKGADEASKRLAASATHIIADDVQPHVSFDSNGQIRFKNPSELDRLAGIRDNMGRILTEHSDDIVRATYMTPRKPSDGGLTGNVDGEVFARFDKKKLDLVLLDITSDDKAYQALLLGQVAHMRGRIDQAVAQRNPSWAKNEITIGSNALGHLLEARKQGLVARGKEADEVDAQFRKLVEDGIGLVPIPGANQVGKLGIKAAGTIYENFVKAGYAKAGDWLAEQAGHGGGKTAKAYGEAASNEQVAQEMVKQMLQSSTVAHENYRRDDLRGPFVVGDPPRIKALEDMTAHEHENFEEWLRRNSTVPDDFGKAQSNILNGANDFDRNVGIEKPKDASGG